MSIKYIFKVISFKYKSFKEIKIQNEDIESIEKNDFCGIAFDMITI